MAGTLETIDPKLFWRALGVRAIGGAVVTATGSQGPAGFLALSATHLTQDPPSLMVSVGKSTSALATILEAKHFAVNYLGQQHAALADIFGGKSDLKGAARFQDGLWTSLASGAPALKDAVGVLDCVLTDSIERHNTLIILGNIVATSADADASPLVYFQGKPHKLVPVG